MEDEPSSSRQPGLLRRIKRALFTKEDHFNFHKTLGITCLLSYVCRFGFVGEADMRFGATKQTLLTIAVHTSLSVSSLIFKIPLKRISSGYRIWPEYRLHSIAFACRSLAGMLLTWCELRFGMEPNYHANAAIVIGTLLAADGGSLYVGDAGRSSTIRDLEAGPETRFFFSAMQFHATMGCLWGLRRFSTQFLYVWIIQFTAFLMTLRRKNLAPHNALVRIYGVMLSFGFIVATNDALTANSWALLQTLSNTAAIGRLGCRLNKYVLWAGMSVLTWFARKSVTGDDAAYAPLAAVWPYTWALSVVGILLIGKAKLEKEAAREAELAKAAAQTTGAKAIKAG